MRFHIGYLTRDRRALAAFYRKVLGFEVAYRFNVPAKNIKELMGINTTAEAIVLKRGNIRIEFLELKLVAAARPASFNPGIHHLALMVSDPDQTIKLASSHGGRVRQTYRHDHMTYYIEDPEGNIVEVSKLKKK